MEKLCIAGSRGWLPELDLIEERVRELETQTNHGKRFTTLITGCASGVDIQGIHWAEIWRPAVKIVRFEPQWSRYGKQAGLMRNLQMAAEADVILAFWDGSSTGTKHMIETAAKLFHKPVVVVRKS